MQISSIMISKPKGGSYPVLLNMPKHLLVLLYLVALYVVVTDSLQIFAFHYCE